MSMNHLKNVWALLKIEGLKSALEYDLHQTKRRYSSQFNSDGRYINGLDNGVKYISESNRPAEFKQAATQLLRDMTHNGTLYFSKTAGLKDLVDSILCNRLEREVNTVYRIIPDEPESSKENLPHPSKCILRDIHPSKTTLNFKPMFYDRKPRLYERKPQLWEEFRERKPEYWETVDLSKVKRNETWRI